jgi:iron complex transport system substrate-binding protein
MMSATSWLNGAAAIAAVIVSAAVGGRPHVSDRAALTRGASVHELADASGHVTRIRNFRRIVSGSTVADRLLVELCEPDRIVAFTAYGAAHSPFGYQYAGKKLLEGSDVEEVIALKPDLVITNSFGTQARLARLRDAGIEVFDLGEARGLETLLADARSIGALVGHRERGERWATAFAQRFSRIAADIPVAERKRAIYLAVYGNQFFGAATGSSYHDILTHAGLVDAAAEHYSGWPKYSPEEVLELNPEVIVTKAGMRQVLCGHSELANLNACNRNRVVEIASELLDDPGPTMLEVAEELATALHSR